MTDTATIAVVGMNCARCVAHVSRAARGAVGVKSCDVNPAGGRASVRSDPRRTVAAAVARRDPVWRPAVARVCC